MSLFKKYQSDNSWVEKRTRICYKDGTHATFDENGQMTGINTIPNENPRNWRSSNYNPENNNFILGNGITKTYQEAMKCSPIEIMSMADQLEGIEKLSKGATFQEAYSKDSEEVLKLKLEIAELKLALLEKK